MQVVEVYEDSGAAAAGLRSGDEILFVDDVAVTGVADLVSVVQRHRVGDLVELRVLRRAIELTVPVLLSARVDDRELLHRRLVDKPAPSVSLQLLDDGRRIDPSAVRGKVVVLAWFSTRCDECGEIISELSDWAKQRRDTVVAAVTAADPTLVSTYLTRTAIAVPVAVAQPEDFEQYGLLGPRIDSAVAFVVIDREGVVRLAAVISAADQGETSATVEDVISGARRLLRQPRR